MAGGFRSPVWPLGRCGRAAGAAGGGFYSPVWPLGRSAPAPAVPTAGFHSPIWPLGRYGRGGVIPPEPELPDLHPGRRLVHYLPDERRADEDEDALILSLHLQAIGYVLSQ